MIKILLSCCDRKKGFLKLGYQHIRLKPNSAFATLSQDGFLVGFFATTALAYIKIHLSMAVRILALYPTDGNLPSIISNYQL